MDSASQVQDYAGRFEAINEELRNANLRLRELSLTDELTEVGNRRNFDVRIREEINRSTRFGHAFSLLLLDIDQFKAFNDAQFRSGAEPGFVRRRPIFGRPAWAGGPRREAPTRNSASVLSFPDRRRMACRLHPPPGSAPNGLMQKVDREKTVARF